MTIAVIGARGFVGSAIVTRLLERGHDVLAVSRKRPAQLPDGARWRASPDLDPASDWSAAIDGARTVILAAARVHVMHDKAAEPFAEFRRANCDGALALARQCAGAAVGRFVFISSIKVNGEATSADRHFDADDAPAPVDAYGISKAEAEAGLHDIARATGMELAVVRPPLVYGPGVKANFAALLHAVASGWPLPLGAIRNRRSMIYLENLADLVCELAINPAAAGEIFLAGDGSDFSTPELVARLAGAMHRPARLWPVPPRLLEWGARILGKDQAVRRLTQSLVVDDRKARDLLGWEPLVSVDEAFARTVLAQ